MATDSDKAQTFSSDLRTKAKLFKALSHPARLAILQYLSETKVCMSGDISDFLPLSRSTVHQHLKELKNLGIIKGEISGVNVKYCIDHENLNKLELLIKDFTNQINPSCK